MFKQTAATCAATPPPTRYQEQATTKLWYARSQLWSDQRVMVSNSCATRATGPKHEEAAHERSYPLAMRARAGKDHYPCSHTGPVAIGQIARVWPPDTRTPPPRIPTTGL